MGPRGSRPVGGQVREGQYERATGPPMDIPPGVDVVPIHDAADVKTSKKAPMAPTPGSRRTKKISKKTPLRFVDVTSQGQEEAIHEKSRGGASDARKASACCFADAGRQETR